MKCMLGLILAMALLPAFLLASSPVDALSDVPQNWTAPPYWMPPAVSPESADQSGRSAPATGRHALVASPSALPFFAVTPCRVADTRGNGFTGAYGPPNMIGGASRDFTITGQCGIPVGAAAVSFNFTVWNTLSFGDLKVFPTGGTVAAVSTLNWNPGMLALANAAVVPLGTSAQITTVNEGGSPIDLFIDVNGYYTTQNSFCLGADCRTSWNGQDANSVTPLPRNCAPGQVPVATGSYQWKCGNICQAAGTADCGGTSCVHIDTDPNNCGACASVCPAVANGTLYCSGGACGFICNTIFTACGSVCRNLATDPNNCGSCNNVCAFG